MAVKGSKIDPLVKAKNCMAKFNLSYEFVYDVELDHDMVSYFLHKMGKGNCGPIILETYKVNKYSELIERIKHYVSIPCNTRDKFYYLYGSEIGEQKYLESCKDKAVTKKGLIKKYGDEEGIKRWNSYCSKQAESNTFEYKNKKYGMSKEEFDEYNKSRAVTYDNLVKRHGKEKGEEIWNNYCERQAYTNTKDHLGDRYEDINKLKKINLENMIRIHGKEEGIKIHIEYLKKISVTSKTANYIFDYVDKYILSGEREFVLYNELNAYLYDYINHEYKICIEFQGDFWHMNPKIYNANDFNPINKKSATEIWEHDKIKKESFLEKYPDYTYLEIWESDAYNNYNSSNKTINEDYMNDLVNNLK